MEISLGWRNRQPLTLFVTFPLETCKAGFIAYQIPKCAFLSTCLEATDTTSGQSPHKLPRDSMSENSMLIYLQLKERLKKILCGTRDRPFIWPVFIVVLSSTEYNKSKTKEASTFTMSIPLVMT